jgi:hypothetical protein
MVWDRVVVYRRCTFGEGKIFLIRVKADGFLEFATWLLFAVLQRKTANILALISLFRFSESEGFCGRGWLAGCFSAVETASAISGASDGAPPHVMALN